jgi:hypothetical protein
VPPLSLPTRRKSIKVPTNPHLSLPKKKGKFVFPKVCPKRTPTVPKLKEKVPKKQKVKNESHP